MITQFKIFETSKFPIIDSFCDNEFWKMVKFVNWEDFISRLKDRRLSYNSILDYFKIRLYTKYEYNEIRNFYNQYEKLYDYLYKYLKDIWSDPKYKQYSPGDDGFSDILSSIIGKGKTFVNKCLNDKEIVVNMSKNDDYAENFGYLLNVDLDEYDRIRCEYDPEYREMKNFNL